MAVDPHFDKVSLLLHCDGADGSTTFVDSSPTPKTVTRYGGAQISAAQSKFGGASLYLPGGSGASAPVSADFQFMSGLFTLEAFVYPLSIAGTSTIFYYGPTKNTSNGVWFWLQSGGVQGNVDAGAGGTAAFAPSVLANVWTHIAFVRHSGGLQCFVNGVGGAVTPISSALGIPADPTVSIGHLYSPSVLSFHGYIDELRITKGVARYTANFTPPTEPFPNTGAEPVSAYAASATPLGAPSARASFGHNFYARASAPSVLAPPQALALHARAAYAAATGPLGTPTVLTAALVAAYGSAPSMLGAGAATVYLPLGARIAAPSPLGAPQALAFHDFTGQLGDTITRYVMDLLTPTGTARVPISSWQATLQTGSSNYTQCVIPACSQWVDTLNAATEFVIWRRAVLPSGAAIEYEMARAPADTLAFDQSPSRHTCTLSGYSDAFAESLDPPAAYDRELTGLRTISSGSSLRVRCAVDWLLRPGHRAFVQGVPFVVRYINYYAPAGFDSYMDVGE